MKRRIVPILAVLAGGSLILLLVYGVSHQAVSKNLDEQVAKGMRPLAPDAARTLPVLSGRGSGSLGSHRGQVVLLNFWASWCEPCQTEAPLLQKAQAALQEHGGTVLGVTYDDASPDSKAFIRRFGLTYPNLRDVSGAFAHSYGTDKLPESFIIDRSGHVTAISRGEIDKGFIERAVTLAQGT